LNRIIKIAREFGRDQSGVSLVEYALFIALITIVCIVAMTTLGGSINDFFSAAATTI
jgi:Flp pilus assembly pilin Flp